jgi:hypothetical protein
MGVLGVRPERQSRLSRGMTEHDFDTFPIMFIVELSDYHTISNRSYRCSARLRDVDTFVQGCTFEFMSIIDRPLFTIDFRAYSTISE